MLRLRRAQGVSQSLGSSFLLLGLGCRDRFLFCTRCCLSRLAETLLKIRCELALKLLGDCLGGLIARSPYSSIQFFLVLETYLFHQISDVGLLCSGRFWCDQFGLRSGAFTDALLKAMHHSILGNSGQVRCRC